MTGPGAICRALFFKKRIFDTLRRKIIQNVGVKKLFALASLPSITCKERNGSVHQ